MIESHKGFFEAIVDVTRRGELIVTLFDNSGEKYRILGDELEPDSLDKITNGPLSLYAKKQHEKWLDSLVVKQGG